MKLRTKICEKQVFLAAVVSSIVYCGYTAKRKLRKTNNYATLCTYTKKYSAFFILRFCLSTYTRLKNLIFFNNFFWSCTRQKTTARSARFTHFTGSALPRLLLTTAQLCCAFLNSLLQWSLVARLTSRIKNNQLHDGLSYHIVYKYNLIKLSHVIKVC